MKIIVTQNDINAGGHHCNNCPVAIATKRAFTEIFHQLDSQYITEVSATGYALLIIVGYRELQLPTPDNVAKWILTYDLFKGKKSNPFEFEINSTDKTWMLLK